MKKGILAALFSVVLFAGFGAQASIIDNTPPTSSLNYFQSTGPDIAGGTFFADDNFLTSFTLNVVANSGGGTFSAIVMSVVAGTPNSLLWSSAITAIPGATTQLMFAPLLGLAPGTEYFIGIDTGQLTGANGSLNLGFTGNNIAGQHWENLNSGNWVTATDLDIASRIVMSASIPEPATLAIFGFGLAALGLRRRRKLAA